MKFGELLAKILPLQVEGKATGGAIGSIQDALLTGKYDDDSFVGALAFIPNTTDGLAPQGQINTIQSYSDASGTFVLGANFSAAVGSGDFYAIADPQYRREVVTRVVNDTLRNFGIISLVDTSITTADNTLEYSLPLALKAFPLDRVEIGNELDGWGEAPSWYVLQAAAGAQAKIVFDTQPVSGETLRIWYRDYHSFVENYGDDISETIPDGRIIAECRLALHEWIMEKNSDLSEEALRRLGMLQQKQAKAEVTQRINLPNRRISKFLSIRDL